MLGFIVGLFLGAWALCAFATQLQTLTRILEIIKHQRKLKMMNKSKAIKNSECYYELNMLNLLLKMNLLTEEEYKSILEIVLEESESVFLTA